jgi:hypothetical protein
VDRVPDALLLRKSGSAWSRTQTSGSVARNPDHQTTEAVCALRMETFNSRQNLWVAIFYEGVL